jgi:GT2 family glycosyltransferase
VLIQVGGFDERYFMNEDTDLSNRIRAQNHELYVSPDPVVYHKRKKILPLFLENSLIMALVVRELC